MHVVVNLPGNRIEASKLPVYIQLEELTHIDPVWRCGINVPGTPVESVGAALQDEDSILKGLVVVLKDGVSFESIYLRKIAVVVYSPEIRVNICDRLLKSAHIQTAPIGRKDMAGERQSSLQDFVLLRVDAVFLILAEMVYPVAAAQVLADILAHQNLALDLGIEIGSDKVI